jgi:hypothetical protein
MRSLGNAKWGDRMQGHVDTVQLDLVLAELKLQVLLLDSYLNFSQMFSATDVLTNSHIIVVLQLNISE